MTAETRPRLSVALCTYNGERYLAEQLDSVASQTRLPDELVVCDDRSTDGTVAIVREFAGRAPFPVHVTVQPENLGSTRNFQSAIRRCQGDLIACADQDDVWLPEKLEQSEAALLGSSDAVLAFTDARVVGDDLRSLGYTLWQGAGFSEQQQEAVRRGEAVRVLLRNQVVTGAAMLFHARLRNLLLPIPGGVVHDGWIALLAAAVGRLVPVAEPLMLYRQHAANQIGVRRTGLLSRVLRPRPPGVPAYLAMALERYSLAHRRLTGAGVAFGADIEALEQAVRHLRTRAELPRPRALRLPAVARELANGRYFRYSNGLYSAAEDLL